MKKVCMIYTGGTIGMKKTENGYYPEPNFLERSLKQIHELSYHEVPEFDLIEYSPLLDSSNVQMEQWTKIAKDIFEHYDDYCGFVILHGTDTMAYTAAALSFMLQGLSKPIVLTGSQIPLEEIRSDARDNIISSLMIAGEGQISEVCVFFANKLFRGNRCVKISSDEKGAFSSPNYPVLAESGITIRYFNRNIDIPKGAELLYTPIKKQNILVLKAVPGIPYDSFTNLITEYLDALVIEAFGSGNIPNRSHELTKLLQAAEQNNTAIVICTQCLRGTTSIGEYETSSQLKDADAICAYDMTVESTVAKLYYLLSKGYNRKQLKKWMEINIAGELSR